MSYFQNILGECGGVVRRYKHVKVRMCSAMTDAKFKRFQKLMRYMKRAEGWGN